MKHTQPTRNFNYTTAKAVNGVDMGINIQEPRKPFI